MTRHLMFIQNFYDECPEDIMIGTAQNPAYFVGEMIEDGESKIFHFNFPDIILATFGDKQVNLYVEDYGLIRNVRFSRTLRLESLIFD